MSPLESLTPSYPDEIAPWTLPRILSEAPATWRCRASLAHSVQLILKDAHFSARRLGHWPFMV